MIDGNKPKWGTSKNGVHTRTINGVTNYRGTDGKYYTTEQAALATRRANQTRRNAYFFDPKRKEELDREARNYTGITSNDNTRVMDNIYGTGRSVSGRKYNTHSEKKTLLGARVHRAGEEDNPTLTKVGYAAGALPFAVAAAPFAGAAADAAASSSIIMNPITQNIIKGVGTSMLGGLAVDAATTGVTGKTWGENMGDLVANLTNKVGHILHPASDSVDQNKTYGWNPNNSFLGRLAMDFTNPGYLMTPGMASAARGLLGNIATETGNAISKGTNFFNSPLTGNWTLFGNKYYRLNPNILGSNGIGVESKPLIEHYPGYLLKILTEGNALERQLSNTGTISINSIRAHATKGSAIEQEVINKVLSERFAGQKKIDYNDFRKAVQDELITYDRKPDTRYEGYGAGRLGYPVTLDPHDTFGDVMNAYPGRFETFRSPRGRLSLYDSSNQKLYDNSIDFGRLIEELNNQVKKQIDYKTFTFESPRIPKGSNKHYDPTTLGHSRTYTTPDEPDVLHVMENQSDWGLSSYNAPTRFETMALENIDKHIAKALRGERAPFDVSLEELISRRNELLAKIDQRTIGNSYQALYLHDNYLRRLLQELHRYAAEHGLTKMRYPTRETAAKIEGYSPIGESAIGDTPYYKFIDDLKYKLELGNLSEKEIAKINSEINRIQKIEERWRAGETTYHPKLETILDKYSSYPKSYKKLYKNSDVRIVTDPKGNTWYETDIPSDYLNQEWIYKKGGTINKLKPYYSYWTT